MLDDPGPILRRGRAAAARSMVDTCVIRRVKRDEHGQVIQTTDEDGVVTPERVVVYPDPYWPDDHPHRDGKCKVKDPDGVEENPEAGGHTFTISSRQLDVPVTDYAPKVGDEAEIVTSRFNPHLPGRTLRVVRLLHESLSTAYRLGVTDEES
jgi:hypothetical protein